MISDLRSRNLIRGMLTAVLIFVSPGENLVWAQDGRAGCDGDTACRPPGPILIETEKGTLELGWRGGPYVDEEGWLSVISGETLHVQLDAVEGVLVPRVVDGASADPDKTITLSFAQGQIPDQPLDMLLIVSNPFNALLFYKAGMVIPGDLNGVRRTSVCPVGPHIASYEHWPHPIVQLWLVDFRLVEPQEGEISMPCE